MQKMFSLVTHCANYRLFYRDIEGIIDVGGYSTPGTVNTTHPLWHRWRFIARAVLRLV